MPEYGEEITYIKSLHTFEKRCIHHYMLYGWMYAFKILMPELNNKSVVSRFYGIHGNENFNSNSANTEYARMFSDIKDLEKQRYFNSIEGVDDLHSYQKRTILVAILYSWALAYRLVIPGCNFDKSVQAFFKKHGCSNEEAKICCSKIGITDISAPVRRVEKANAKTIKNFQQSR